MHRAKTCQNFWYRQKKLMGEELDLERIALEVGTPCYVYSRAALLSNVRTLQEALHRIKPLVCFAVKANQNLAVLRLFADEGAGFDIVSGGELYRVLRCGADPAKVIYSGVGKTQEEIEMALAKGILMFNVESRQEIELIRSCARQLRKTATIALRVNPDIAVQSHPYMQTGTHHHKFGIDYEEIPAIAAYLRRQPEIRLRGIACHIGSQITSLQPFEKAFKRMAWMFRELCASGIQLETINLGGGLGVRYKDEKPVGAENYAQLLEKHICPLGARILLEPGRYLVRDAGLLMTRLLYTKTTRGKIFYIVDAGMNDLVRPTLYHAWHEIQPLRQVGGELLQVDVVGPLCETGDFLARNRQLPRLRPGALLAVMQAAAYGQVQSSNYNARRRAPEVMIQGNRYSLIRRRETYADLLFQETLG